MTTVPPQLELAGIHQAYDDRPVVRGLTFSLARGAIGCLLGPSGCGKTTALRCIAGFEPVSAGTISLAGTTVSRPGLTIPPEHRRIGMVFQDHALFPHLDVARNVGFGLHALPARERASRVATMLDAVGLAGAGARYPHELSGGSSNGLPLPAPSRRSPISCCSTSRFRISTSSCASACRSTCATSSSARTPPQSL